MSATLAWSPPALDPFPERRDPKGHWLDPVETALLAGPRALGAILRGRRSRRILRAATALEPEVAALDEAALLAAVAELRTGLRRAGLTEALLGRGCALLREASRRILGQRHHDVQILGGLAILDGRVAEMDTGEGKTLTAAMAVALAGLAGIPTHVVTVNDYLAERDAEQMGVLYRALGLTVGVILHDMPPPARIAAYAADITYASNKELAFDYLRDRLALGRQEGVARLKLRRLAEAGPVERPLAVMRGLHFVVVDEADSVLIDEARTPLIISRETDASAERLWAEQALSLADALEEGTHYRLLPEERRVLLTEAGRAHLADLGEAMGGIWTGRIRREEATRQALSARLLFQRGDHYLVREGKVEIVDENTGRIQADRSWSDGLHQIIEAKEGVEVTARKLAVARMTYQRLFRRYRRLSGMTGTAREAKPELWSVYRLRVARIPPNLPSRLARGRVTILPDMAAKWQCVVERAREESGRGRAVLIGTRSVSASLVVSAALRAAGLDHSVLNAENDREEAGIVAAAGQARRITVATNMAGRGVDIRLPPEVVAAGGLHVILTERHDAGRIDRQLEGRAGRRGEPGSAEAVLSLEDPLLALVRRHPLWPVARLPGLLGQRAGRALFGAAQRMAQRAQARARVDLMRQEKQLGTLLAFAGEME